MKVSLARCFTLASRSSHHSLPISLLALTCRLTSPLLFILAATLPALAAPAPATVTLAVTAAGSTVSSVVSGTAVTLTATLTSTSGTPYPGQVIFCEATGPFCQNASLGLAQVVNTSGTASAALNLIPGPGAHSYKAVFLGTRSYAQASSSAQALTVTAAAPTTTTLTSTGSAGSYGLTAQIAGAGPYVNPTGTISFLDTTTSATLGSSSVAPGTIPSHFSLDAGTSTALGNSPANVRGLVTGDFNGDGKLDVAVEGSPLSVELANGDGTFHAAPNPGISAGFAMATGDFNNDGKLDLVVSAGGNGPVTLLLGDGQGAFTIVSPSLSVCPHPEIIVSADFNNDGNADLALSCDPSSNTTPFFLLLLGNGDGTFASSTVPTSVYFSDGSLVVADFDGDGNADLAVTATLQSPPYSNYIAIFRGNGDGTFQPPSSTTPEPSPGSFELISGDFNGDGKPDLATAVTTPAPNNPYTQSLAILLNNGDGTFAAPVLTPAPTSASTANSVSTFVTLDLNGDGKTDLAVTQSSGTSLLLSNGDGTFDVSTTLNPGLVYLVAGDLNGDGVPDIVSTAPNAASAVSYLVTATHNAAATLSNIAVGGSGAHSITASYTGDAAYAASTSSAATLNATLTPTALTLVSAPATATPGTPIALTATLSPASLGNLNANGETITFTGGGATLGTATLSAGVAVLNTTLPVGVSSIAASFSGDASFSASSAPAIQIAPSSTAAAVLVSTSNLTFSSQSVGSPSAAQTLTVTNSGQAPLTIVFVTLTGDFAQTNTCTSAPIPAQGTCTISVTFTPTGGGTRTGTLTLTDNAANSPQQISLFGSGAVVPIAVTLATTSAGTPVSSVSSGTAVTLVATITTSSGTAYPGQVMFCDATATFCQNAALGVVQVVDSGGTATAAIKFVPGPGAHSYKAVFLGTRSYPQTSSSPQSLTVTAAASTTTALTSTGSPGSYSLNARISGAGPYASPTGTVSFLDTTTSATLGRAPVTPGSSTFSLTTATSFAVDSTNGATGGITGDFNGDGILDFAVGNELGNTPVKILLGNGDGTFHPGAATSVTGNVILTADLNDDGKLDLIVELNNTITLLLGNGDGTFAASPTAPPVCPYPGSIATGDVNNDGNADIVINCGTSFSVLLGNGDATFNPTTVSSPGFSGGAIVVADFDGDGNADIAALGFNYSNPANDYIASFRGKGDGTFQPFVSTPLGWEEGGFLVAADFNGDGKLDLAAGTALTVTRTGPSGSALAVLLNHGDGTFTAPVLTPAPGAVSSGGYSVQAVSALNLNGDGNTDLALGDSTGLYFLLSNGDATFTIVPTSVTVPSTNPFGTLTTADFNGDGLPDILNVNVNFDFASVYLTSETHAAAASLSNVAVGGSGTHSITASYSGDSAYTASTSSSISLTATRIASTLTVAATPTSAVLGGPITLTATLTPSALGNLNTNGETITFTSGTTTLGTATLTSGVATLNTTTLPVGTNTINATFPGDSSFAPASAAPVQVSVSSPPAVSVSAPSLTFASQTLASTSAPQTIIVTNSGQAPLTIASVTATGDFAQINNCAFAAIPALGTCTVSVTFTPTAVGSRTGTLTLTDNAANSPQTLSLAGTGARVTTALTLAATPDSATTGAQIALKGTLTPASLGNLNTNGDTVTFTSGATTLGTAILASGVATLNTTTLPLGTNTITASFPGETSFSASAAPPIQVSVTAPLLPAVTLSASALTYAIQAPASTSAAQTITVTNSGQAPLLVSSIAPTGDFAQTSTCTSSAIAVGGTCTISVTFTPTAAGTRTGTLTLADNAASSPQTVTLTGTGAPISLTSTATSLNITTPGGGASTTLQMTAATGFSGTVALTCAVTSQTTTTLLPTCALNPAQGSVSPGSPLSSTLTISTTAASARLWSPFAPRLYGPAAISLAGMLFAGCLAPAEWRKRRLFTLFAVFGILAGIAGCGGHSSSSTSPSGGTPAGAYVVTVTAAVNSVNVTTAINLTVQ